MKPITLGLIISSIAYGGACRCTNGELYCYEQLIAEEQKTARDLTERQNIYFITDDTLENFRTENNIMFRCNHKLNGDIGIELDCGERALCRQSLRWDKPKCRPFLEGEGSWLDKKQTMTKEYMKNLMVEEKKYMRVDPWFKHLSDQEFEGYWAQGRFKHLAQR